MSLRLRLLWAIVLAVAVGVSTHAYLRTLRNEEQVVVASRDIPARTVLGPEWLTTAPVNAADRRRLLPGSVTRPDTLYGAVTVQEVAAGMAVPDDPRWVTRAAAARQGDETRLAFFLPDETRAVTVTLDGQALVGKQVHAGDRVDVIFTSTENSTGGVYSALILQQAQVLAIAPAAALGEDMFYVTFLVTPAQSLDLNLAKRKGRLDLALSPPGAEPVSLPAASPLRFVNADAERG